VFALRLPVLSPSLRSIDATFTLARRGLSMLRAKRAIEVLMEKRRVDVHLPTVENPAAVLAELERAGIAACQIDTEAPVDVRRLREQVGLTREAFSLRYGLEPETVRNWESGKRELDGAARSYLRAIANNPEQVADAYAPAPPGVWRRTEASS
jgi:DNA-binding transcriptional regulator YiaG